MSDSIHEILFKDMLNSAKFNKHIPKNDSTPIKYVCLTDKNCQIVGDRTNKRLCLILYGPGRNHFGEENTIIHGRVRFVDDFYGKNEWIDKKYNQENYLLFEKIKNFLRLCPGKPDKHCTRPNDDRYGDPDRNWYFFCLSNDESWPRLSKIIREFNNLEF